MTPFRAFAVGLLAAVTVCVLVGDGVTFTLLFWLPSIVTSMTIGAWCHAAATRDAWRELERRDRTPRSVP